MADQTKSKKQYFVMADADNFNYYVYCITLLLTDNL